MAGGGRVVVVTAHPDDETIGCGALLRHLSAVTLVVVTDGAPRDMQDARARGFASAEAYAAARAHELDMAIAAAECDAEVIRLGIPDQAAARNLTALSRRLAAIFRQTGARVILAHAYEGGHPDHDAAAFAAHMAARLAGGISVIEMPFYRLGPEGMLAQSFTAPHGNVVEIRLSPPDRARKQRMIAAHASQQGVLAAFDTAAEYYRPAPHYDFTELPNQGRLLYEQYSWGLTGAEWRWEAKVALYELAAAEAASWA